MNRGFVLLDQLMQDLRYAARAMRRTPGFSVVATLCLAVGISVNTAAFSMLNAIAFRDFPGVTRQNDLVTVTLGQETRLGRSRPEYLSSTDWEMLRAGVPAFAGIAAANNSPLSAGVDGDPQAVRGAFVSASYFEVLGTRPAIGRFPTASDGDQVAAISYAWWMRKFAGRRDIVGRQLTIGTRVFSITGVAPEGFFGLYPGEFIDPDVGAAEVFVPLGAAAFLRPGTPTPGSPAAAATRWLQVFGRLREGATLADAETQATAVAAQLAAAHPVIRDGAFAELRAGRGRSRDSAELIGGLLAIMAVPAIILLVACANLANQLLARAIQRGREVAVRLSLGATRNRVVRQLLVETAMLAAIASGIGVLLARWMLDAVRAFALPIPFRVAIDLRVLAFTVGLALLTALAFGLVPALRATRMDLAGALKEGAPGSGYRRSRLRNALVVAQVAASVALIALSTVFVRAAERPPSPSLDAIANRALMVSVNLDLTGFDSVSGREYERRVTERLQGVPGVAAVGVASFSIFGMHNNVPIRLPGQDASRQEYNKSGGVSGAWFEAVNVRAMRGRLFSAAELAGPPTVAVVDEVFAREMWGDRDAVGQPMRVGPDSAATIVTVVGVVPAHQEVSFRQPEGVMFVPAARQYRPRAFFYIRTTGDAQAMLAPVRNAVRSVDPRVPILSARTLEAVAASEVAELALIASGMASLGAVALALAALGLFGVLSFIVAQRRHEFGVRVALGARRVDVTGMVLKQALRLGVGGAIVGGLLAMSGVALVRSVVHGIQPLDLVAFGGISAVMVVVALLASALPARRAASVDPMVALRME